MHVIRRQVTAGQTERVEDNRNMRKRSIACILIMSVLSLCACKPVPQDTAAEGGDGSVDNTVPGRTYDYPDQLIIEEGGTAEMALFRCGTGYYACLDGEDSWEMLAGAPLELEDGEFIYAEADYKLLYGGIAGYMGRMQVTSVRNEHGLSLDDIVDMNMIVPYDSEATVFSGLQLIEDDGKNYLICKDPLFQYRLYDDSGNLLCTYDAPMAVAAYLDDSADQTISYGSSHNVPFWIMRIGDVYYAYSRYAEFNTWTPLLNTQFENKPVGFELTDGQAVKVLSTSVYKVNGGADNYINAPMFEKMENIEELKYHILNSDASAMHWEEASNYENGKLYQYFYGTDEYLIFFLNEEFYVYYEDSRDAESRRFIGTFSAPDEVNTAVGR